MKFYKVYGFLLYVSLLVSVTAGCKNEPKKQEPIMVTTVVDAAMPMKIAAQNTVQLDMIEPDKNFDTPMDNLTETDEVDAPSAEEIATAKKDAPRLMQEWRDHGWKTPRYLLKKYLDDYGLSPKQLGITQEDAEDIMNN